MRDFSKSLGQLEMRKLSSRVPQPSLQIKHKCTRIPPVSVGADSKLLDFVSISLNLQAIIDCKQSFEEEKI